MKYTVYQEQLAQLSRIYNTFLEVPVKGEGAFLQVDALRAFQQIVQKISEQQVEENTEIKE